MEIPDFPAGAEERINGEKREKFRLFREILLEYNRKYNLTSITDEREIVYKHFLDSAAGAFLFPFLRRHGILDTQGPVPKNFFRFLRRNGARVRLYT